MLNTQDEHTQDNLASNRGLKYSFLRLMNSKSGSFEVKQKSVRHIRDNFPKLSLLCNAVLCVVKSRAVQSSE